MRTITVFNRKGGVGKTSAAVNLAGLLANAGHKTVLVNLDAQIDPEIDLGVRDRGDQGLALVQAAMAGIPPEPVRDVRPNLDLVCGGPRLEDLKAIITNRRLTTGDAAAAQAPLVNSLRALAQQYTFVIIDSPPGGSIMQEAALTASRWVLVPTAPDEASISALEPLSELFLAARQLNPDLGLLGVFLFGIGATSRRVIRQAADALSEMFEGMNDVVMTAPVDLEAPDDDRGWMVIRDVKAVAVECRARGLLVHELESLTAKPTTSVKGLASDYEKLAREVVLRVITAEQRVIDLAAATAEVTV
ncbi:MAG TPA: ParA family protein [Kineosporiaceae bacterium]|nr:ParA family protein [Kineosporiaceae bacterium]